MHEVLDDNSKYYKSTMINTMRINHGYLSENSCVEEKPDVDLVRFFYLLKDSNELL